MAISLLVFTSPVSATVSGEDGRIAYVSSVSGSDQIYVIDTDGSNLKQITFFDDTLPRPSVGTLRWSPDGRVLTFGLAGNLSVYPSGVWIVDADGTNLKYVTSGWSPSWSPDGQMLAFSKEAVGAVNGLATRVISTIDLASGIETTLTDPGDWVHDDGIRTSNDYKPVWTPDGSTIVFLRHFPGSASISADVVYSLDVTSGDVVDIGGSHITDLDVHPGGDTVITQSADIVRRGYTYLTEVSLIGGAGNQIDVPEPSTTTRGVSYAPSGGAIAATLWTTTPDFTATTQDIWIRETDGSWRFLVAGRTPAWQPVNPYAVGLVNPATGEWQLRDTTGAVDTFYYGNPGDLPFMGDWDCDGTDTPGLYRQTDGYVYLRNANSGGVADITFFFGDPGDIPLTGDFNGDGCDTVSVYRPSTQTIFVINELGAGGGGLGAAEFSYVFGNPRDTPFVGDFDGDGVDTIGLHRATTGLVYFRNTHTGGNADDEFYFGNPGDRFVAADWNGDGSDTPAVFRPGNTTMYFRFTNTQGDADARFIWGEPDWLPVAGTFTTSQDTATKG